jgi:hypothetical protein
MREKRTYTVFAMMISIFAVATFLICMIKEELKRSDYSKQRQMAKQASDEKLAKKVREIEMASTE